MVGNALDNVAELQRTGILCNDDGVEWVPLGDYLTLGEHIACLVVERATVRHVHRRKRDACMWIDEADFSQTAHYHLALAVAAIVGFFNEWHRAQLIEFNL